MLVVAELGQPCWHPRQTRVSRRYVVIDFRLIVQGDVVAAIICMALLTLIPVLPTPIDMWVRVDMAVAVKEKNQKNHGLRACLVLNQLE